MRWAGGVFIITSLFLAIGAFNGQNNLLFFTFGLSVSAILLSGLVGGSALLGVRVRRTMTGTGGVGSTGVIVYEVQNHNRFFPILGVLLEEVIEPEQGPDVGLAVWKPGLIPVVRAGERVRVRSTHTGSRSGVVQLRMVRAKSCMPFGLLEKRIDFELPGRLEIHPAILPVRRLLTRGTGRQQNADTTPTQRIGGSEEFHGVREYVHGDSTRSIAWAKSATHDSLVVRTNSLPRPESMWIEIRPDTEDRLLLELTLSAGASLATDRIQSGVAVGLVVPSWGVSLRAREGRDQLNRILSVLAHRAGPDELRTPPGGARVILSPGASPSTGADLSLDTSRPETWTGDRATLPAALRSEAYERHRRSWVRLRLFSEHVETGS